MSHATARTAAEQVLLERLEALDNSVTRQTEAVGQLRGLILNSVLRDELVVIPAAGFVERSCSAPFASVGIGNYGANTMTVAPDAGSQLAPTFGRGVKRIPAGGALVWALTGTVVTVWGTAGDVVLLTLWATPQAPMVAGSGSLNGGGA